MSVIPDDISFTESLTHALFHPNDYNKERAWLKERAFQPPKKNPGEISFNRACYTSDSTQKNLAKAVNRVSARFVGFVRMDQQRLKKALEFLVHKAAISPASLEKVDFIYTPIFDLGNMEAKWPDNIPKLIENGHNAAHCDLVFRDHLPEEASSIALALSSKLAEPNNQFCQVIIEDTTMYNDADWTGEKLCEKY